MRKKVLQSLCALSVLLGTATASAAWTESNLGPKCQAMAFPTGAAGYSSNTDIFYTVTLKKTVDGGKTWATVTTTSATKVGADFGPAGNGMFFTDASTGFAQVSGASGVAIGKTTDGGVTWTAKPATGLPSAMRSLARISFGTKMDGAAIVGVGAGVGNALVMTHDGGETWQMVKSPDTTDDNVNVAMLDAGNLVLLAIRTMPTGSKLTGAYVSHDNGFTWKNNYERPTSEPFGQIEFLDGKHGYLSKQCTGVAAASNECVMATSDGGDTWTQAGTTYLGSSTPSAMAWADVTHGLVAYNGDIFKTVDGKTWAKETLPATSTGTNWPCMAYPGPSAIAGGGFKTYIYDDGAGGGPRPALPPGGTTTSDAGPDAASSDATTSDSAPSDASPSDASSVDSSASADTATPTDGGAPPGDPGGDGGGGGCTTSPRRASAGWLIAALGIGLVLVRSRKRA